MRLRGAIRLVILTAAAMVLGLGAVAVADIIENNVVVGGNDTITAGSATTVKYQIQAAGGCEAADDTPANVRINTPTGVTASPSTLTFSACGVAKEVTFSSSVVGSHPVTVSVTDSGGGQPYNTNPAGFTLNVRAAQPTNKPPVLTVPATGITVEGNTAGGATVNYSGLSATDAEDGTLTSAITCTPASGSLFARGTTTVHCSVTDSKGATTSGSFPVTVLDTTAPALKLPEDIAKEATGPDGAKVSYSASAADVVDGDVATACSPASGATFALGATTVECSATDASGNKATGSFKVSVVDTTAPVISDVPQDITKEATGPSGAKVEFSSPTAADAVDGHVAVSCAPQSGDTFALGDTTVDCSATDAAKNKATTSFKVSVVDTIKPSLDLPDDLTREATSADGAKVGYTASAEDLVDGELAPQCAPASDSAFPLGTTTVECSATDAAGNQATDSFDVTVVDTTAPALKLPEDITAEATSADGAAVSYTAAATDAVDGAVKADCSPASGSTFDLGERTVECSAADARGNQATGSFKVTVVDTTAPAISDVPEDIKAEATGPNGAKVEFASPKADDLVSGSVDVACEPASGSTFGLGATTVDCEAADARGNKATKSFKVTVVDTTAPALKLPEAVTAEATSADGAKVSYAASATDLVDEDVAADCSPAPDTTFALGATTVDCSATDASGNKATGSFKVTVVDTTAPAISDVPEDIKAEATGPNGAKVEFASPKADDLVSGSVDVACEPASGSTFALGETRVDCSATDAAKNKATKSFKVTVVDTTAPAISDVPEDIKAEATGPNGAKAEFASPKAADLVDGDVAVNCSPQSGDTFALGETTVDCSATDAAKNKATKSFKVSVVDTTKPSLDLPEDITKEATGPNGAAVSFSPSADDLVDGDVDVTCSPQPGSTFELGKTTVACSATDAAKNKATGTFDVTVVDTTAPALKLPEDLTKEATGPDGAKVSYSASASDLVDGDVAVDCSPASGSTFALGTTTVECSAADARGNKATGSFKVAVVDTTAPKLELPEDQVRTASSNSQALVRYSASATDLVDGAVAVSCTPDSGASFPVGTTPVSCQASDARGNKATGTFDVTVNYSWTGFFQPIDTGAMNVAKSGSTIPVKFRLAGNQGLGVFETGNPSSGSVACSTSALQDTVEEYSTATTSGLKYDALADQYIYNWKTDAKWAGTCRQLVVKLQDGSVHRASFRFAK